MTKIKSNKLSLNLTLFVMGYLLLFSACFSMNVLQEVNGDSQLLAADKDAGAKFKLVDRLFEKHISQKELSNLIASHVKATMLSLPQECTNNLGNKISISSALWSDGDTEVNREIEKLLNNEEVYRKAKDGAHFFAVQLTLSELNELLTLPKTKAVSTLMMPALSDLFVRSNMNKFKEIGRITFENVCANAKP